MFTLIIEDKLISNNVLEREREGSIAQCESIKANWILAFIHSTLFTTRHAISEKYHLQLAHCVIIRECAKHPAMHRNAKIRHASEVGSDSGYAHIFI